MPEPDEQIPESNPIPAPVCTCGARLLPDSRFCHKCGKPQREDDMAPEFTASAVAAEAPPPPLPIAPSAPRIGFFNPQAVGVALIAWGLTFLVSAATSVFQLPQVVTLLTLPLGGFLAVFLYKRRTGQKLTMRNGAQLGWLCGIFGFIMATFALAAMVAALSEPSVVSKLREQFEANGIPSGSVQQMIDLLRSPAGIAGMVLMFFVMFTVLPAFGGAIGAKLLGRDGAAHRS